MWLCFKWLIKYFHKYATSKIQVGYNAHFNKVLMKQKILVSNGTLKGWYNKRDTKHHKTCSVTGKKSFSQVMIKMKKWLQVVEKDFLFVCCHFAKLQKFTPLNVLAMKFHDQVLMWLISRRVS